MQSDSCSAITSAAKKSGSIVPQVSESGQPSKVHQSPPAQAAAAMVTTELSLAIPYPWIQLPGSGGYRQQPVFGPEDSLELELELKLGINFSAWPPQPKVNLPQDCPQGWLSLAISGVVFLEDSSEESGVSGAEANPIAVDSDSDGEGWVEVNSEESEWAAF